MLNAVRGNRTQLLPGIFRQRMALNEAYLMELDPGCLLQNFYLEAGIIPEGCQVVPDPEKAKMHWGWEAPSCQLRGHFLGHWLSAAAALCEGGERPGLRAKLDHIVAELARCQQLNGARPKAPPRIRQARSLGRRIWCSIAYIVDI